MWVQGRHCRSKNPLTREHRASGNALTPPEDHASLGRVEKVVRVCCAEHRTALNTRPIRRNKERRSIRGARTVRSYRPSSHRKEKKSPLARSCRQGRQCRIPATTHRPPTVRTSTCVVCVWCVWPHKLTSQERRSDAGERSVGRCSWLLAP